MKNPLFMSSAIRSLATNIIFSLLSVSVLTAQVNKDLSQLTIDRIYSGEFQPDRLPPVKWIAEGEAYIIIESNKNGFNELIRYSSSDEERTTFLTSNQLTPVGEEEPLRVEGFSLSADESKVLIFTNSRRVWRSNTKGDYWVYDLSTSQLSQIGKGFPSSSLMFAKFSDDNQYVAYVMEFNIYKEDFATGEIMQLTSDGTGDIINGTFDWVYEEEFGCRDGFEWNPEASRIAYWQLDASEIGDFNMINNTDSIYSRIIPIQYPKVGQDPSSARIGIVDTKSGITTWVELEGSSIQNYIPSVQWIDDDQLMIQQINRKQNHLKIWIYSLASKQIRLIYEETEDTWVDISYPDKTVAGWKNNKLELVNGKSFLRLTEEKWRNLISVSLKDGEIKLISPDSYDVAKVAGQYSKGIYYQASPQNSTQRYLYAVDNRGKQKDQRLTPSEFSGINVYDISPNGKYAMHSNVSALAPTSVNLISLPDHKLITNLVTNEAYKAKLDSLELPEVEFTSVRTEEGLDIDARIIKPVGFDPSKQYPVIFHVYGEPWGQSATDSYVGLWNIMLAQKGYFVIDIDNRGTPCLKGSEWRKSIYRNIGRINILDMAQTASELIKLPYVDSQRVGVWGWSGGGSSTLNLMFQYPEIFKVGVSVAPVANQLTYDNIYQERYMGLPKENEVDFIAGSPVTHAKNLEGDLLLIHGTADDNVHYQNAEMLINELIKHNKQFDMMSYPNRSHGIYEGRNTRRHLFNLITNYFQENLPLN